LFFVKGKKNRIIFIKQLDWVLKKSGKFKYWHDIINVLISKNNKIQSLKINPYRWFEMDNLADFNKINNDFLK